MPSPLGPVEDHFWRLQRMAKATRTDLVSAYKTPDLPAENYAALLTRCRGCTDAMRCDRLLTGLPNRDDAPAFCSNKDAFFALRAAGHVRRPTK